MVAIEADDAARVVVARSGLEGFSCEELKKPEAAHTISGSFGAELHSLVGKSLFRAAAIFNVRSSTSLRGTADALAFGVRVFAFGVDEEAAAFFQASAVALICERCRAKDSSSPCDPSERGNFLAREGREGSEERKDGRGERQGHLVVAGLRFRMRRGPSFCFRASFREVQIRWYHRYEPTSPPFPRGYILVPFLITGPRGTVLDVPEKRFLEGRESQHESL